MKPAENIKGLIRQSDVTTSSDSDSRILGGALIELEKLKTDPAATGPNIWRIIMKSKTQKYITAATIIIGITLLITFVDKSATPAYGITEAINLCKTAKTFHIHGWAYMPIRTSGKQETAKVPFEHWFDVDNGRYRIVKPGDIDKSTGKRKYFTTVCDGKYVMSEIYKYPVNRDPYKAIRFQQLTPFQNRLRTHNNSYMFIMQTFGGIENIKGFKNIGNEEIDGLSCDIWQGLIAMPGPKNSRQIRIKSWILPDTGELFKIQTAYESPETNTWIIMYEIDQIEFDIELPEDLFETEPPDNCVVEISKEEAPLADLGFPEGVSSSIDGLTLRVNIGFTLADGSVILCWQSTDTGASAQDDLFTELTVGSSLPKLPLELYAVKPIANVDIELNGYHLTHTVKDGKFYEWSIYVSTEDTPSRNSIMGYELLHKYNADKNKIVTNKSAALHQDIPIKTDDDFNNWVLAAMAELSDSERAPENITYQSMLELAEQIRKSQAK